MNNKGSLRSDDFTMITYKIRLSSYHISHNNSIKRISIVMDNDLQLLQLINMLELLLHSLVIIFGIDSSLQITWTRIWRCGWFTLLYGYHISSGHVHCRGGGNRISEYPVEYIL